MVFRVLVKKNNGNKPLWLYKAYDHISSILVRHELRWTNHPIRGIYPVPTEEIIKVVQRLSPRLHYCISIWYNQKFLKCYKNMKKLDTKSKSELKQTFISTENIIMKVEWFQEKVMFWKALKKTCILIAQWSSPDSQRYSIIWQLLTIHRHFTFTFKHFRFVMWLRENYDYHNVSWETICIYDRDFPDEHRWNMYANNLARCIK